MTSPTPKSHTSREFDRELRQLRERLLAMGGRAERQIARAITALTSRDEALVQQVLDDDARIDQDEREIDELALLILARRQPVASDLRFILLAMKIVTDLERIGDLAVNIARRERQLRRCAESPVLRGIEELSTLVLAALRGALDAFSNSDADAAEAVIAGDREIDLLNTQVIGEVISSAGEAAHSVEHSLALSSVSRYLERIGDHATNVAEMVIYFVRGRDVRHDGVGRR
jgi:phosphate transport system protein